MTHRAHAHVPSSYSLPGGGGQLIVLPIRQSDAELVAALKKNRRHARDSVWQRYSSDVHRVLQRILGSDPDLLDVLQDVFLTALTSIQRLEKPDSLRSWLVGIAVRKARTYLQRRTRWRFFHGALDVGIEPAALGCSAEMTEAVRHTYALLGKLPADEHIAFALRYIDGMELTDVADACRVSLATIKRKLARAEQKFFKTAIGCESLARWTENGASP